MNLAIVHDYLNQYGGAEKVVETFHELYPENPIFTSIFQKQHLPSSFSSFDIRPSFMQHLPFLDHHFKKYLLLYPYAIERFKLDEFDLVLSSSSAFAKGASVPEHICHVSYCYSPMRFAWYTDTYLAEEKMNQIYKSILPLVLNRLRKWDLETNKRVDYFIAISNHIKKRIKKNYNRDADVIYPPVDISSFYISQKEGGYFVVLSRLNAYKRIDLVIEAFNQLSLPLMIIGTGSHEAELKSKAGPNIRFLGKVAQKDLSRYLSECRALIFPGTEDFGIAPVEAMASGRPVIAFAEGGALETVVEGETGVFFHEQSSESLVKVIRQFLKMKFSTEEIRHHAQQFDKKRFKREISAMLDLKLSLFQERQKRLESRT